MYPLRVAQPTFANAFALLSNSERSRVKDIIGEIRRDPTPDDVLKFSIPYLGSMYVKYEDFEGFWVLYYVQDDAVWAVSCGHGNVNLDPVTDVSL